MINFLLKNPNFYRFYQKTVRAKYDEYDFFKFIFKQNNFKNVDKKSSIVFIDTPYITNPFNKLLINLIESKIVINNAIIVLETSKNNSIQISSDYLIFKERSYGKTKIYFLIKKCLTK